MYFHVLVWLYTIIEEKQQPYSNAKMRRYPQWWWECDNGHALNVPARPIFKHLSIYAIVYYAKIKNDHKWRHVLYLMWTSRPYCFIIHHRIPSHLLIPSCEHLLYASWQQHKRRHSSWESPTDDPLRGHACNPFFRKIIASCSRTKMSATSRRLLI